MLAGALLLTAAPKPYPPLTLVAPLAPDGGGGAPSGFAPAPMPDEDMATPADPTAGPQGGPSVMPGVSRPGSGPTYQSGGYTHGSTYNNTQDNRFRPMPTLNLSVPLQ